MFAVSAMTPFQKSQTKSSRLNSIMFYLILSLLSVVAADECAPYTWTSTDRLTGALPTIAANKPMRFKSASAAAVGGPKKPGEVNCRFTSGTYEDVNYYTCTMLAEKYSITVEKFFILNPDVDPDCGNIQPYTDYCVAGYTDGRCGPPNNNATCRGYPLGQCCNSETWTCGNSTTTDCALGTCYEGQCFGDRIYSTDGTCGYAHGDRRCAGKWGDCCNMDGKCGTGADFCADVVCQSGNCTRKFPPPALPTIGNTTGGSCGGPQAYVCNFMYGNCCNKDGVCGSLPSDCGAGCQPEFGRCSSTTSTPTPTSSSTGTSTTSAIQT